MLVKTAHFLYSLHNSKHNSLNNIGVTETLKWRSLSAGGCYLEVVISSGLTVVGKLYMYSQT